jgi:WD40 repeat protein
VRIWDAQSGAEMLCLRGHEDWVTSVAYSPDGRRLASAGDKTVRVWDAQSGECLEVIQGEGDIAAIAAGPSRFPWRALGRGLETVIEDASTGQGVAWFPEALRDITTHPAGRTWAGVVRQHVYILVLEGEPRNGLPIAFRNPG